MESIKVLKQRSTTDFPELVVPEGADELTLGMKKVQCALSSTPRKWETKGGCHRSWMRTGTPSARPFTREAMYYPYKELHETVKSKTSNENKKAGFARSKR